MLAGKVPWEDLFAECDGNHAIWESAIAERVLSGERPGMDDSWPELLRALMEQCWARAADARPAMQAVQANLTTGFSSGGASAHGPSRTSARSGLGSSGGGLSISGSTSAADDAANLSAAELEKKRLAEAVRRREAEETRRKMKEAEAKAKREAEKRRREAEDRQRQHHGIFVFEGQRGNCYGRASCNKYCDCGGQGTEQWFRWSCCGSNDKSSKYCR
jgi:hypothetical protein